MLAAACSKLCSSVSAYASIFARIAMSSVYDLISRIYFANPTVTSKMWHKVFFLQNTASFMSEFFFFLTVCLTKTKKPSLTNCLPIPER